MRLGHRDLLRAAVASLHLPPELLPRCMALLQTAAAASPAAPDARARVWPGIKAGLLGLGVTPKLVERCEHVVLTLAGPVDALERSRERGEPAGGDKASKGKDRDRERDRDRDRDRETYRRDKDAAKGLLAAAWEEGAGGARGSTSGASGAGTSASGSSNVAPGAPAARLRSRLADSVQPYLASCFKSGNPLLAGANAALAELRTLADYLTMWGVRWHP